jgi:cell division transport system permease protein
MRRYSPLYFIGQSFKGLWRNGVMSMASIMVLMSCLVVMGSFALLVFNINSNLEQLGALNDINCYVDTTISGDTENDDTTANRTDYLTQPNLSTESGAALIDAHDKIIELDSFINVADAKSNIEAVRAFLTEAGGKIEYLPDADEMALQRVYYASLCSDFERVETRIASLESLEARILALDNVATVTLTTKAAGLEEMRVKFEEYPSVFENFKNNTLPDRFTITYRDNAKISTLEYNLEHLDPKLYKVICNSDVAETMENIKQGVVLVFTWFLAILFVVSLFVIMNTIKLAVYARRQEISIMRYVGATNWFITLPFALEGVIIGIFSGSLAYAILYYFYDYIQGMIQGNIANLINIVPFNELRLTVITGIAAVGVLTGVLGSIVSLHKYTKA